MNNENYQAAKKHGGGNRNLTINFAWPYIDNIKIGKEEYRDHKKYLNKMKILVTCKFYCI